MTYKTRFQYLFDKASDIAQAARTSSPHATLLPPLIFVTDPARIHHPEDIARHLPAGCGIIYRHFGETHARERAQLLRRISHDRGLILLIGEDEVLADEIGADGVHLRELGLERAGAVARPGWIVTAACHGAEAMKRAEGQKGLAAVLVSPVFVSASASAQGVAPLGRRGLRILAEAASLPVIALGGITCDTIEQLHDCCLSGVAAVDAFRLQD
jgi:thiamine-phosphate pyrophosphorylase